MTPLRLGAVSYLNTKPLVYGLDANPDQFTRPLRRAGQCAALLHEGRVDLGLIPAIEYLRGDYRHRAGRGDRLRRRRSPRWRCSAACRSTRSRTLALDISSRTSVALTRVLCAKRWGIAPSFTPADPDLETMLARADAALVIGDPALGSMPPGTAPPRSISGSEWRALTGLPFVYAMWSGRAGAASPGQCRALQAARDRGVAHVADIARAKSPRAIRRARRRRSITCVIISSTGSASEKRRACAGFTSWRRRSASCPRCNRFGFTHDSA